jgi:hypothetical protein
MDLMNRSPDVPLMRGASTFLWIAATVVGVSGAVILVEGLASSGDTARWVLVTPGAVMLVVAAVLALAAHTLRRS